MALRAGSADAASLAMTLKGLEALLQGPVPVKCFVQVQHFAKVVNAVQHIQYNNVMPFTQYLMLVK